MVVGIATTLRTGRSGVPIPVQARYFSLFQDVQIGSEAHPGPFPWAKRWHLNVTTYLLLVSRSIMSGAILLLPLHGFMAWTVKTVFYSNWTICAVSKSTKNQKMNTVKIILLSISPHINTQTCPDICIIITHQPFGSTFITCSHTSSPPLDAFRRFKAPSSGVLFLFLLFTGSAQLVVCH
jgi:hypothetical protein